MASGLSVATVDDDGNVWAPCLGDGLLSLGQGCVEVEPLYTLGLDKQIRGADKVGSPRVLNRSAARQRRSE